MTEVYTRPVKAYLVGLVFGFAPAFLGAQPAQYGYVPQYATADLPSCSTGWANRVVLDTTAGEFRRCDGDSWEATYTAGEGSGLPVGGIMFILSGSCPSGYAEETSLAGKFLVGTTAGAGDVGGTGGSDNITPAGTNSGGAVSVHAGTAVADHASHTHTYTDVIAHTHTLPVGATDDTSAPFDRADAGTNASGANATTASGSTGVATGTTAGPSATLTHSVTQPSAHTFTQPTFAGTQFDNRPAFIRLIPCRKT